MEARVKAHTRQGKYGLQMVKEYGRVYEPSHGEFDPIHPSYALNTHVTLPDFDKGTPEAYNAVAEATHRLIEEQLKYNDKLSKVKRLLRKGLSKVKGIIKEKTDIKKQYRDLKALGKKHGPVFMAYAIAIEIMEDVVLPAILTKMGHPEFTPILLAWHSEWFMYPLYFGVAKLLRKHKKLEKAFYVIMERRL